MDFYLSKLLVRFAEEALVRLQCYLLKLNLFIGLDLVSVRSWRPDLELPDPERAALREEIIYLDVDCVALQSVVGWIVLRLRDSCFRVETGFLQVTNQAGLCVSLVLHLSELAATCMLLEP